MVYPIIKNVMYLLEYVKFFLSFPPWNNWDIKIHYQLVRWSFSEVTVFRCLGFKVPTPIHRKGVILILGFKDQTWIQIYRLIYYYEE